MNNLLEKPSKVYSRYINTVKTNNETIKIINNNGKKQETGFYRYE